MPHWWQLTESQRNRRRAGIVRMVRPARLRRRGQVRRHGPHGLSGLPHRGLRFGRGGNSGTLAAARRRRTAIARAASQELTADRLAERFEMSPQRIRQICRAAGVAPGPAVHPNYARVLAAPARLRSRADELASLFRSARLRKAARLVLTTTATLSAIAARCGLTQQRVQQVWNEVRRAAREPRRSP